MAARQLPGGRRTYATGLTAVLFVSALGYLHATVVIHRNEYRMDVVMVTCACGIFAGKAGNVARRSILSAASSSSEAPEALRIAASITRPERSIVNRTETLPSSPRSRAWAG